MSEPFRVLCADPPWKFDDALPGEERGASRLYDCMSLKELATFPLPPLAEDCVLFLWRVTALQQDALYLANAWGFRLKTEVVWLKKTSRGRRWFGMGRITRAEHEVCLVATRGRPQVKRHDARSTFVTDLDMDFEGLSAYARRHSEKPEVFYDLVESLYDGPYVELFARRHRPGWTCLGNELDQKEKTT